MGWKTGDDCELGTLLVDWGKHRIEMEGIDGLKPDLTPQEILEFLKKPLKEEKIDRFAIVYWHEAKQLCLYGIDDFSDQVLARSSDEEKATGQDLSLP